MKYPSNPNPNFPEFEETFDDFEDIFGMIMSEIGLEDYYSSSPAQSLTSSEKLVTVETNSSSVPTNFTIISPMSLETIKYKDEMKKRKRREDSPIIHIFKTKSTDDSLDDGYKWRKYGKKPITGSPFPRHYHKCSNPDCIVKKKIERDINNPEFVLTTYEGVHNHQSPSVIYCDSEDLDFISLNMFSFSHSAP